MKKYKHILPLISTVIIAVLIIYTGYNILARAGKYLVTDNNNIVTISSDKDDSYVFYSQTDNDIVLFPWNYSNNAVNFSDYYDFSLKASDVIETTNLYEYLRYYFYRIIPDSQKNYIFDNGLSLSEIMDYDNLEEYITINQGYYFYSHIITILNSSYYLNVSFNSNGYIYAFQCREIRPQTEYTTDIMARANSDLTSFLNDSSRNYIGVLLKDIYELYGFLDNYVLNISQASYSSLNFRDDIYYDKNFSKLEVYTYDPESGTEVGIYDIDTSYMDNTNSYQLVKTQYEYLILMTNLNITIHYDPVSHTFNGFNISS